MKKHNVFCRLLCTLLIMLMLTCTGGVSAFADDAVLTIGTNVLASSNDTLNVPVIVSGMNSLTVVQFALTYDPEMLEYVGFTEGDLISGKGGTLLDNHPKAGEFYFTWFSNTALQESGGTLITLQFNLKNTGITSLDLDEAEDFVFASVVSGSEYNEFEPTIEFGTIVAPDFFLPAALTEIDSQAFNGVNASVVYIPENVSSISADAFDSSALLVYKASSTAASAVEGLNNPSVAIP